MTGHAQGNVGRAAFVRENTRLKAAMTHESQGKWRASRSRTDDDFPNAPTRTHFRNIVNGLKAQAQD